MIWHESNGGSIIFNCYQSVNILKQYVKSLNTNLLHLTFASHFVKA